MQISTFCCLLLFLPILARSPSLFGQSHLPVIDPKTPSLLSARIAHGKPTTVLFTTGRRDLVLSARPRTVFFHLPNAGGINP
jgi:hypothetical protein